MSLISSLGLGSASVIALCGAGGKSTLMFALAEEFGAAGERVLVTTTTKMGLEQICGRWPSYSATDAETLCAVVARSPVPVAIAFSHVDAVLGKVVGYSPATIDQVSVIGPFKRILVEADGSAGRPLKAPALHEPVFPLATDVVVMVAGANGLQGRLSDETVFRARLWSERSGIPLSSPVTPESLATMVVHPEGLAKGAPERARRVLFLNQCDDPRRLDSALRTLESLRAVAGEVPELVVIGQLLPSPRVFHEANFNTKKKTALGDRHAQRVN